MVKPFIGHNPGEQDPDTFRQFQELQSFAEDVASDLITWGGAYEQGQCFEKGTIVSDDGFLLIANKDTCDKPAPAPSGDPFYVYDGATPTEALLLKSLQYGNEYTFSQGGYFTGYRFYTVAGNEYEVWQRNPDGVTSQIATITATSTGWAENAITPQIFTAGTTFTLFVIAREPDPAPTVFTLSYNYLTRQNPAVPANGQIQHSRDQSQFMDVSKTDANGVDQSAQLAGLDVGDTLEGGGIKWSISAIADSGTYYRFTVSPAVNTLAGLLDFTFETVTATPITYVRDPDFFLGNANVQPFFSTNGDPTTLSDDGFGVDIQVQYAAVSEDWDIMASGGGGGGGGGDFVAITGDTMTGNLVVTPPDGSSASVFAKNSAGNSASLESTGNSHLWFRGTNGLASGLLYLDVANDEMKLRKYNNGSSTAGITFYNDGDIAIQGDMRVDVNWGGKAITNIKYIIFNGTTTTGDYIRWDTADGFRTYENGSLTGRIGSGGADTRFIQVYNVTTSSGANVNVSGSSSGILKRVSSSGKYKQNIETLQRSTAIDSIMALRPVVYQSKIETDPDTPYQGFITEEVAAAMPIALADDGENYDSRALIAALVATVQELKEQVDALK